VQVGNFSYICSDFAEILISEPNSYFVNLLLFLLVFYVLTSISLYKVFEKAGESGTKALIPGYNFVVWCKIIGRPAWWAALLLIPLVNIFIFAGMAVDMVRSFGKLELKDSTLAVILTPLAFFLIGKNEKDVYQGGTVPKEKEYAKKLMEARKAGNKKELHRLETVNPYQKSAGREWVEAVVFAVFAATFIRMFLIEPYVIPTSSMEGSLNVGDFLFVSKVHYGSRAPMTLAQLPLVHNTIPFLGGESYLRKPSLGYSRAPKIEEVQRNIPFVFNYPEGDSVYVTASRNISYHDLKRMGAGALRQFKKQKLRVRPVDKKDHYIKRCVALPGDKLEVRDRQIYINDKPAHNPTNIQFRYTVKSETPIPDQKFDDLKVNLDEINSQSQSPVKTFHLSDEQVEKIKALGATVEHVDMQPPFPHYLFPHDPKNFAGWTVDNYGPITVPAKGTTVTITPNNISLYRRIIGVYEDNKLEIKNGRIFINGEQSTTYTFKQDYFWAMGDNRHNSEDSRVWGFVPEDHVVGKPLFIWFSTKNGSIFNGINWDRIFTSTDKL